METIIILGQTYEIISELESVAIVDSFVKINKLKPAKAGAKPGHGEARLYIGPQKSASLYNDFFENFNSTNAFFLKDDFNDYLKDAKYEYVEQEQKYYKDISSLWKENIDRVQRFRDDVLYFNIDLAIGKKDQGRYYVRSKENVWEFFRIISLPVISYVSILKLKSSNGSVFFYFRVFLDYQFNINNHPSKVRDEEESVEKSKNISVAKKETIIIARIGQGKFRENLLKQMFSCPITDVSDERLLMASHIKPWVQSNDKEKIDPFNGIIFTPTYDKMFDQGFISFEDDGTLLVSPYISPLNIKKLNLIKNKKYNIQPSGREKYLDYHRNNIFKKP
jgi:putative restriction endonuclease